MTIDEFTKCLGKLRKRGFRFFMLANRVRLMYGGQTYCPITAVCRSELKQKYTTDEYGRAAALLKIDGYTVNVIIDASDGFLYRWNVNPIKTTTEVEKIRRRMLRMVEEEEQ